MKDKYEKVVLGVAALIAIAMVVLGVMKLGAVEEDFPDPSENPKGSRPIESDGLITENVDRLSKPLIFDARETEKGREVDTFTAPNLYVRRGTGELVDPDAPGEKPVHPPIPNADWEKYGLSDVMGYGDAPQQDSDDDGFSNLEEFKAGTHPNDKNSFPSLFAKVKMASVEKYSWLLRFSDFGEGALSFRVKYVENGRAVEGKMKTGATAKPGDTFFAEGPFKGRFKFVEALKKESSSGVEKTYAKVEDLKFGKRNQIYEIPPGKYQLQFNDYTARLYLDTPDQEGTKFSVEEGMSFSLPYDEDAAEKPYTLKEIGGDGTTALLLWDNNGETKELELRLEN